MALKDNLIANEEIVFESQKHWFSPLRDSLIPILLLLGAYFVGWLSPDSQSGHRRRAREPARPDPERAR